MRTTLKQQLENEYVLKDFLSRKCDRCLKSLNCSLVKKARKGLIQSGLVLDVDIQGRLSYEIIKCRAYRPCLPITPKGAHKGKVAKDGELFPGFVDVRKWG